MLSARQLLLMRRACDRAIGIAIAPTGGVALLPDPDFRRRVFGCVSHVGVSHIASIKYPTLLNDSALANDNKNCSRASPSRDLALASPPSPLQTAAGCAAPSPSRRVARSLLAGGGKPSGFRPPEFRARTILNKWSANLSHAM